MNFWFLILVLCKISFRTNFGVKADQIDDRNLQRIHLIRRRLRSLRPSILANFHARNWLKNLLYRVLAILPQILSAFSEADLGKCHAITYENGARFGDRMQAYAQARYVSYATSLPFLFRPFIYSQFLTIENEAYSYELYASRYQRTFYIRSEKTWSEFLCQIRDTRLPPTLFIVDYCPSDISEWDLNNSPWSLLFNIPWKDENFAAYLKKSCLPKIPIPDLRREGFLNVADHVRTYSGGDNQDGFPLKQVNLAYHKQQIRRVYEWNLKRPTHVFLFSDTQKPLELLKDFQTSFVGENLIFDVQVVENVDVNHVIQDFFAMQKFDVLICTQSCFSTMASRLGCFDMVISPVHHAGRKPDSQLTCPWAIDRVRVVNKKSLWLPYDFDVILKEPR